MAFDVVSFGETMLRLSPPMGVRLEDAQTFTSYVAGTESNVLACLARLGLRCAWLSALPASALGRRVAGLLQQHGVNTSHVVWAENRVRLGLFYAEELARPIGVQVEYDRADSACTMIDPDRIDLAVVDQARLLHLTGITPAIGEGAREAWRRLLQRARAAKVPISFDVNYRAKLWSASEAAPVIEEACKASQIVFCTRDDAAELWNTSGDPRTMLHQLADRFGRDTPDQTIVLTLGSEGAMQIHDNTISHAAAFQSDGAVRFGSGDAFAAGYLYAYLNDHGYEQLQGGFRADPLTCGNAAAALKRCIAGDIATITLDDLQRVLRGHTARFR